jgi:hypothetical protein
MLHAHTHTQAHRNEPRRRQSTDTHIYKMTHKHHPLQMRKSSDVIFAPALCAPASPPAATQQAHFRCPAAPLPVLVQPSIQLRPCIHLGSRRQICARRRIGSEGRGNGGGVCLEGGHLRLEGRCAILLLSHLPARPESARPRPSAIVTGVTPDARTTSRYRSSCQLPATCCLLQPPPTHRAHPAARSAHRRAHLQAIPSSRPHEQGEREIAAPV